jgi:type I restriction enzyme S subunit
VTDNSYNGWPVRQLKDITLSMRNGIVGPVVDRYVANGVPYLMANNIREQRLDDRVLKYIDPAFHAEHKTSELQTGDVLTVQTGWIGVSCVVPPKFNGANTHALIISRPNPRHMLGEFLCYLLNSEMGKHAIWRVQTGGGRPHLNTTELRRIALPVPPLDVQKRIVSALSGLDGLNDRFSALIHAKCTFKLGLVQQLLTGHKRFPEFAKRRWHTSRLGDHVNQVVRRNSTETSLVLTASGEHGLVDQRRYFNRSVAGADLSRYYLLKRGEFAYNRSAMNGYPYGATKRLDEHDEGALSTLYLCFSISDPNLNSDFLKHVFDSGVLNRQLRPIVRVGARAHGLLNVTDEDYLSITIPFPELIEQVRIASVLNTLDREIALLAAQRVQTELYKRSLLSKLLSGEHRVSS